MFLTYERNVVKLAEHMGLPLASATGMDIAAEPHLLDGASALISPGHDEYWTPAERAHVTAARDAGVRAEISHPVGAASASKTRSTTQPPKDLHPQTLATRHVSDSTARGCQVLLPAGVGGVEPGQPLDDGQ
jgi:hypothetical protein